MWLFLCWQWVLSNMAVSLRRRTMYLWEQSWWHNSLQQWNTGSNHSKVILPDLLQRNTGKAVVGSCLYTQNHGQPISNHADMYIKVNANLSLQDQEVCGYVNREGQFCGNCKSNHHVSACSYELKCYQCNRGLPSNIFFYMFVAYFPLTIFLVAVMVFHISVASPHMNAAVLLCQTYSLAETIRVFLQNTSGTRYETVICLVSIVSYRIVSFQNPGYVAMVQMTLSSRGKCLLQVGWGHCIEFVKSHFRTYHHGSHLCFDCAPRSVC